MPKIIACSKMTEAEESYPFLRRFKNIFIGRAKAIQDKSIFHKLSLVAFFAWIGLGVLMVLLPPVMDRRRPSEICRGIRCWPFLLVLERFLPFLLSVQVMVRLSDYSHTAVVDIS
jgi:hypothetical protein